MSNRKPADQLYHSPLQMHREAFDSGRYELGYYVLAAAFHAADELASAKARIAAQRSRERGRQAVFGAGGGTRE